jgi:Nickel responsive protein SCO4226-like
VLYAAKCYWPGVTEDEVENAAARLHGDASVGYVGSLVFPGEALVLCLFSAAAKDKVRTASQRAGIPCERVMSTRWIADERSITC